MNLPFKEGQKKKKGRTSESRRQSLTPGSEIGAQKHKSHSLDEIHPGRKSMSCWYPPKITSPLSPTLLSPQSLERKRTHCFC